jgi:hypothetical protein
MRFVNITGGQRGIVLVDAGRAAGKNETFRIQVGDFIPGGVVGDDFTIYIQLTDTPGDEHTVLRAEINDDNNFTFAMRDVFGFADGGLSADFLGNFKIGGDFNVVAGSDAVALFVNLLFNGNTSP